MSRTLRQILKDSNRTGAELALILIEKLKNQVQGTELIVSDKELFRLSKELKTPEDLALFRSYELILGNLLNVYNFSRQTTYKFYASYNAIQTLMDKVLIYETAVGNNETPADVLTEVYRLCPDIKNLEGKTKETYEKMFDAVTFIEASNVYIRTVLAHYKITGLNCFQYNIEELYILMDKLNKNIMGFYNKLKTERAGECNKVFFYIKNQDGQVQRKNFLPETQRLSEFKEYLRTETNRVVNNAFSFIMLLQNKNDMTEGIR